MSRWVPWYPIDVTGLDAALDPMGTGRGSELHLGTIIKEMKRAAGENVESIPGEQEWLRAQVGFLWEAAVEYVVGGMDIDEAIELAFKRHMRALRQMARQVKLERDGVHMTPDGIDSGYSPGEFVPVKSPSDPLPVRPGKYLLSWKATWRGAGKAADLESFEDNFWSWHTAEKAYAAAAQIAGLLPPGEATCRFEVLWVRGDYRGAGGPKALGCEVTWSPEELESNWTAILAHRTRLGL